MIVKTVTTTYSKNYVEINAKYICKCGHTFYRKNRDWFTLNPLSTLDYNASRNKIKEEQSKRIRECPRCSEKVKPKVL